MSLALEWALVVFFFALLVFSVVLVFMAATFLVIGFVRWLGHGFKVRCPACDGTGLCELGGDDALPHSCCNRECGGTIYGVIGRGYVHGSLLARLLHGGPRVPLGHREGDDHLLPHRTLTTDVRCFYYDKENFS